MSNENACTVPPPGWKCSRAAGHEGPCAARPAQEAMASELPMTCRNSNRSDCAMFSTSRPSKEWYGRMIAETEGLDDVLPCGALASQPDGGEVRSESMANAQADAHIAALRPTRPAETARESRSRGSAPAAITPPVDVAAARLQWLHSPESSNVDGWEYGIFRVKWGRSEGHHEIRHTFADFSDIDEAMAASGFTPSPD